jgi:uncharacterized protein (DUF1800 family)
MHALVKQTVIACLASTLWMNLGCGVTTNSAGAAVTTAAVSNTPVNLSIQGAATVAAGSSARYTATLSGKSDTLVNWSVNNIPGGNSLLGTISTSGLYKAPATVPAAGGIDIEAVNSAGVAASGSYHVVIKAVTSSTTQANTIIVTGPASVRIPGSVQFVAALNGAATQSVAWMVNGITGGNPNVGTITTGGFYTSPLTIPANNSLIIEAQSLSLSNLSGTTGLAVLQPVPTISSVLGWTEDQGQNFQIAVAGSGFTATSSLLIGGKPMSTTFIDGNDLQTTIANPGALPVQLSVSVQNSGPGGSQSSSSAVTLAASTASPAAAARFLDEASFGPTAQTIAHVQQIGLNAALAEQFNEPQTLYSQPPNPSAECPNNVRCTESEFLDIALFGQDQLRQRVAFALSELWVSPNLNNNAMPYSLNLLAKDAFSNYRTIMQDVTLSPQMGSYLNMLNSGKAPAGQIANENYARELMQLFTMGLDLLNPDGTEQTDANGNPIPAYSEAQVEAFARAYTGWTSANSNGSTPSSFVQPVNWNHPMVAVESRHDTTAKTLLDGATLPSGQSAEQDLKAALDNVFNHPNVGPFVSRQLIQHLVTGNPSAAYVHRVANVFDDNGSGLRGDMKAVITAILLDPEARAGDLQSGDQADENPEIDGGHLREPILWTTDLLRGVQAARTDRADSYPFVQLMSGQLNSLGESPFGQESVFNFFSPQYVIPDTTINSPEFGLEDTGAILPKLNLADWLIHNRAHGLNIDLSAASAIGQKATSPSALVDYLGLIFMHNQMPTDMRNALIAAVSAIPAGNVSSRSQVAVYLVVTSSQYKVIH